MATNTLTLLSDADSQLGSLRTEINRRFKMLCSRCLLPVLALYLLLEEITAAVLPKEHRTKREVSRMDQEDFYRLLDQEDVGDLSVGDAGDVGRGAGSRPSHGDTFISPTEHLVVHRQGQYQYNRKVSEKKRKVAPLDSIGGFQMSSSRTRKDEPDVRREAYGA